MERRGDKRYRACGPVEIPQIVSSKPKRGVVLNVSQSGCRIYVPGGVDFDREDLATEQIWLELTFRNSYLAFRATAAVRSLRSDNHLRGDVLGLEFIDLHARARGDIAALIRDQETSSPLPAIRKP